MSELSPKLMRRVEYDTNGGCWLWSGAIRRSSGYGRIKISHTTDVQVHRLAWEETHGPTDLFVLHRCDTPLCINPKHLFVGTHADNMADRTKKGRSLGSRGAISSRVTGAERDVIRTLLDAGRSVRSIAKQLGRAPATIRTARSRIRAAMNGETR